VTLIAFCFAGMLAGAASCLAMPSGAVDFRSDAGEHSKPDKSCVRIASTTHLRFSTDFSHSGDLDAKFDGHPKSAVASKLEDWSQPQWIRHEFRQHCITPF